MKKFFLTMMFAVAAMAGMTQTIGEAFYVYRHDGQCYKFLRNQVDSIVYSHISADGVFHDEVVTQLIYTKDSICEIPLLEVDGIGFVKMEDFYTSCPDSNHPHMIDLGLPSGTKWACCNVGANAPEEYGNYYAWGETQPKSSYYEVTYSYFTGKDTDRDGWFDNRIFSVVDIGSDIAGTIYDAATANWGAPWRMPTWEQIQELLDNTTSTWTTENGVRGWKFTGSNGGTVFLPAAGYLWHGEWLCGAGGRVKYWSSSLCDDDIWGPRYSENLAGYSESVSRSYEFRAVGISVRPVRKN
jgi:hypothetical protein